MPHSFGFRARTRKLFARPFRAHGLPKVSTYLTQFKIGDYVDVKGNGAVQKGMPFKYYHGRTGRVWNVSQRAVGVEVNKQVGGRIMKKRFHVRLEHVKPSHCRSAFLERIKKNNELLSAAKKEGKTICVKRLPAQPKEGKFVKGREAEIIQQIPYEFIA
eukprot:TRINITY_DN150_c0_g1_i1.p2 TRINITY_DN150_c0_g1~~TRINITY_DN150_c0_g1_i1.p2  ORF type:complete len:159 (-),score=62.98 TRINITY_DN150_c0_g1_i1:38-514(-)